MRLSSVLSDASGEMHGPDLSSLSYLGSAAPPVPVLDAIAGTTTSSSIAVSGSIPSIAGMATAAQIKIAGPNDVVIGPAAGSFSLGVPLTLDAVNVLYVSAISPCGIEGPAATVAVIQDGVPPSVSIQFPADGAELTQATTDVAGSVGDMLSGFAGLAVTVNGVPAAVDVGQGTNGTFFARNVPLSGPGLPTAITAVATDAMGNTTDRAITVTQQAIPAKTPFIEPVSGNAQTGMVHLTLGQPVRVSLSRDDGTPFANKLVSFRVTRNNGRLESTTGAGYGSGTQHFQVLTDASGAAEARWTLGSTAGCGANRVEVSARDVAGAVVFCATALPAPANQINIGSGNNQRVEVGAPAPLPLSSWVSDSCNPGAGVPVTFTVTRGGGLVNGERAVTVTSDTTGHADVTFVAGDEAGVNRVEATFEGNQTSPAVFTVYGVARNLNQPTTFRGLVLDNASRPVGDAKVILGFQGPFTPIVRTNEQGQFEITGLSGSQTGASPPLR